MTKIFIAGKDLHPADVSIDYPHPERLISGNPQRTTHSRYQHPNMSCGIWHCEVGAWRIEFAANKQEFFQVIQGTVRLHDADGQTVEIGAGDAGIIPPSFIGVFEVVEAVQKYYVIVES